MISRVFIDNFKALRNFSFEIASISVVLIDGEAGSGKSSFCGALSFLREVALGFGSVDHIAQAYLSSLPVNGRITTFEIDFSVEGVSYQYVLRILYDRVRSEFVVENESVMCGNELRCSRAGNTATICGAGQMPFTYAIDIRTVMLATASGVNVRDPLFVVRRYLSGLSVIAPYAQLMHSDFAYPPSWVLNATGSNLPNWFAWMVQNSQAIQSLVDERIRRFIPNAVSIRLIHNAQGVLMLALQRMNAGCAYDVAFSALSSTERLKSFFAIFCAYLQSCPSCMVVMDDVLRGLDKSSRLFIVEDLIRQIETKGQLLVVSGSDDVDSLLRQNPKVKFTAGMLPRYERC